MLQSLNKILKTITYRTPLTGGSSCTVQLLQTADNISYVYKQLTTAEKDFFDSEQLGLKTLSTSKLFKIPYIYGITENSILLQYIKPVTPTKQHWYRLGEQLAQLHKITNQQYGFERSSFIGLLRQNNHWQTDWLTFYREQRLLCLTKHALFNQDDQARWGKLLMRLDNFLDNSEPPALLHGDLWSNNILFTDTDIYLIDPAVYYGSREIEIAYLEFVGDFYQPFIEAYQANYPLTKNYLERKNLYLLYPYLVHLHLFGKAYLPGIRAILQYYT